MNIVVMVTVNSISTGLLYIDLEQLSHTVYQHEALLSFSVGNDLSAYISGNSWSSVNFMLLIM